MRCASFMKTMMAAMVGASIFALAAPANAAVIIGTGNLLGNPALTGGTQVTFNQTGTYSAYSESGLTISGPVRVTNEFPNAFNTTGTSLDNNQGGTPILSFTFAQPVGAFAFNFGGSDMVWTLSAFSGATLIETLQISPTLGSNNKDYFGLSGSNITSATLVGGGDWVFVDNFTFNSAVAAAVPEPATWAMMLFGFGAVGFSMRSARRRSISGCATA